MKKINFKIVLFLFVANSVWAGAFHMLDFTSKWKLPDNYIFRELPYPVAQDLGNRLKLWATWYNLPVVSSVESGVALRDLDGLPLGPILEKCDWCSAAMEGSVVVTDLETQTATTYNYAGTAPSHRVDCSDFFSWDVSKTKFRLANGVYGDGFPDSIILIPFRTIAVDKKVIPYGTVIYIPEARGKIVTLPTGEQVKHDGYFFAGDKGGAIKNNHIDVFIATETTSPFTFIRNSPTKTFRAYIIKNSEIVKYLTEIHFL